MYRFAACIPIGLSTNKFVRVFSSSIDLGKLDLTVGYKAAPNRVIEASHVPSIYGQNTAAGATYTLTVYFKTP